MGVKVAIRVSLKKVKGALDHIHTSAAATPGK